jgi:hypothetical protein
MGPPSYMRSVVDQNIVMRRIIVQSRTAKYAFDIAATSHHLTLSLVTLPCLLVPKHGCRASRAVSHITDEFTAHRRCCFAYNSEQPCGFQSVFDEDYGLL